MGGGSFFFCITAWMDGWDSWNGWSCRDWFCCLVSCFQCGAYWYVSTPVTLADTRGTGYELSCSLSMKAVSLSQRMSQITYSCKRDVH